MGAVFVVLAVLAGPDDVRPEWTAVEDWEWTAVEDSPESPIWSGSFLNFGRYGREPGDVTAFKSTLILNQSDSPIVLYSMEHLELEGVELLGVGIGPLDGASGVDSIWPVRDFVPASDVGGTELAPGESVRIIVGLRFTGSEGALRGIELRYIFNGQGYRTTFEQGYVMSGEPTPPGWE